MSIQSSRGVRLACVITTLCCMLAGAVGGVILASLRVTGKPPVFRSVAKVVTGGRMQDSAVTMWQETHQNFLRTIIQMLESREMRLKAQERVQALHAHLKPSDVRVEATQTKGSLIITVLAEGSDPRYTQLLLDALLDEFVAFRQSIHDQAGGKVLSAFLKEVVKKQQTMEEAFEAKAAVERDAKNILAKIDLERLTERLKLLSNERDDLRMTLKGTPEDAAAKKERLTLLAEEIQRIEASVTQAEAGLAKLNVASQRAETARKVYQTMFERAENFQNMVGPCVEYVAIMERASFAVEQVDDWKLPVILGGASGAVLGLVGGLIISIFIAAPGRSQPSNPKGS